MKGVPVGRPLFQGSKQELMSPCYRTLQFGADEPGCPLVTLSSSSHRNGVCIHVSVTDVIHKTFPALKAAGASVVVAGLASAEQ